MWSELSKAFRIMFVFTVLTGLVYPAAVTLVAQALFPGRAHGSLVTVNGAVAGSALIGQNFTRPEYFHPRPSAAGADGYDATASSGSNLGPTSRQLAARVRAAVERYRQENGGYRGPIPADAVTSSASGLDPDISPANAQIQAARVAGARGIAVASVEAMVNRLTERPWLGFIGESRVNVLELNLALDRQFPTTQETLSRRRPRTMPDDGRR
jgi:potassium-transporting ATPase KdpC subunit